MQRGPTRQTFTDLVVHTGEQEKLRSLQKPELQCSPAWRQELQRGMRIGEIDESHPLTSRGGPEVGLAVQGLLRKKAKDVAVARAAAKKDSKRPKVIHKGDGNVYQASEASADPADHSALVSPGLEIENQKQNPPLEENGSTEAPAQTDKEAAIGTKLRGLRRTLMANLPFAEPQKKKKKEAVSNEANVNDAAPVRKTNSSRAEKGTTSQSRSGPTHKSLQHSYTSSLAKDQGMPISARLKQLGAVTLIADAAGIDLGWDNDEQQDAQEPEEHHAVIHEVIEEGEEDERPAELKPVQGVTQSWNSNDIAGMRKSLKAPARPSQWEGKQIQFVPSKTSGQEWDAWSAMMTMPRSRPSLKQKKGVSAQFMENLSKEPKDVTFHKTELQSQPFEKIQSESANEKARDESASQVLKEDNPVYAKFKVLQCSSSKAGSQHEASNLCLDGHESLGLGWTSQGQPTQWLLLDFGSPVELCGIKLIVPGTMGDPNDISIQSAQTPEGPWMPVKRFSIPSGPRQKTREHAVNFHVGGLFQYYRMLILRNWGAGSCVSICAPLQFQQVDQSKVPEVVRSQLSNMVTHFCEASMLSSEDQAFRDFARAQNIDLISAEEIRFQFERFDADKSGDIDFQEFKEVLKSLLNAKSVNDIPDNRVKHFWNEVDSNSSGTVDLQEFVVWFHALFYADNGNNITKQQSRHNSNNQGSMVERFYSSFGTGRCGPLLHQIKKGQAATSSYTMPNVPNLESIQDTGKAATTGNKLQNAVASHSSS